MPPCLLNILPSLSARPTHAETATTAHGHAKSTGTQIRRLLSNPAIRLPSNAIVPLLSNPAVLVRSNRADLHNSPPSSSA
ncbi:hypothetical protein SCP_0100010 [Sparassis crispa]|uniref:Uncharacterized protein n=1 Tax=Sparassis crispa TaxID=139825 RepID=A0A401G4N8_9APHY|nr:hypothetical protein SCP_0100010 [Sparassis crispa]GBE77129.1 hypothetical protein SCP_0100010 [Sparassis crispa]